MKNDLETRLQAALDACARMQDQRDEALAEARKFKLNGLAMAASLGEAQSTNSQLAAQLKDATRQCGVMADLLRRSRPIIDDRADFGLVAGRLLRDIDAALAGKMPEQHPDDAAVDRFAAAMKAKLAAAREKGRGGWDDPDACSVELLADLLVGHIGKGNPVNFEDIANLAMMLHQRGADPAVLAGKMQDVGLPLLSQDEKYALMRFKECCDDGQGYDVEKEMMIALASKGALHHRSAGYYEITDAGIAMLAATPKLEDKGAA
jgi:hypothetical protein